MFSARFEPTIPESERLQTHSLDRAATGFGFILDYFVFLLRGKYFRYEPQHTVLSLRSYEQKQMSLVNCGVLTVSGVSGFVYGKKVSRGGSYPAVFIAVSNFAKKKS